MKLSALQSAFTILKQHYSSFDKNQEDECKEIDAVLSKLNDPNDDIPWRICSEILRLKPKVEIGSFIIELKAFILKSADFSTLINNLDEGDLVYGFSEPRSALMDQDAFRDKVENQNSILIDTLNNDVRLAIILYTPPFGLCVLPEKLTERESEASDRFETRQRKYALVQDFQDFSQPFEGNNHYIKRYYTKGGNGHTCDPFIKKRCKLGILWGLSKGKKIHVLLDLQDITACFNKSIEKYTYSELRFIYRNWKQLQPLYIAGRICFYGRDENGLLIKISPPWMIKENNPIIERYKPKQRRQILYHQSITKIIEQTLPGIKITEVNDEKVKTDTRMPNDKPEVKLDNAKNKSQPSQIALEKIKEKFQNKLQMLWKHGQTAKETDKYLIIEFGTSVPRRWVEDLKFLISELQNDQFIDKEFNLDIYNESNDSNLVRIKIPFDHIIGSPEHAKKINDTLPHLASIPSEHKNNSVSDKSFGQCNSFTLSKIITYFLQTFIYRTQEQLSPKEEAFKKEFYNHYKPGRLGGHWGFFKRNQFNESNVREYARTNNDTATAKALRAMNQ